MKRHASMNRIYRLVWSHVHRVWVPVAEITRGRGKGSNRKLLMAPMFLFAAAGHAEPTGGHIVSGTGSISQTGGTTTINQTSQNMSANWQSFNIAPAETVNFQQPNAAAIAVNRIADTNGTQILGHLNANGQVYLINPNGILFGQGAQVNVGGLVASTLDVNDASLNSNTRTFSGTGTGSLINQGRITAADGGSVALLGNSVSNQGVITAQLGTVALGAGSAATLTFNGNNLVKMQIDQSVLNNLAENKQLIQADGGQVIMSAGAQNALLASVVNNEGVIEARTLENHNGTITLLGGMAAGTVNVGGTLDASAPNDGTSTGSAQANGGFIETSAAHVHVADDAKVITAAANGNSGTWLIDPVDFTVAASGGDMTGATLSTNLNGGNVTIQSTSGASGTAGNVNVNDTVSWSANTLTLNAQNNININTVMNGSGTAKLALEYGQGAVAQGNTSTYNVKAPVNLAAGNNFSTKLGSDGQAYYYTVITDLGAEGSTTGADLQGMNGNVAGNYVLGSNIDASATSGWNSGAGFMPIGTDPVNSVFAGAFDGLGHSISNLTINRPTTDYVGLFGAAAAGSSIRNVGLVGGSISGKDNVGGLVGLNAGTVSNSYSGASVSGTNTVGGLMGNNSGTVGNSYASGSGSGTSTVGGLVGTNSGTVGNSYAGGRVSGTSTVGGLAGANSGTVSNSFWDTQTSSQSASAGGTGMTTADMQRQANFTSATAANGNANPNWDFANTWVMYDSYTAPLLRAFMTPLTVTANNAGKTYDSQAYSGGNGVTYSVTPNSNLLGTLSYSGSSQGAINAGSYTITPGGLYSNQQGYIINYANGSLSIAAAALNAISLSGSRVYDGTVNVDASIFRLSGLIGGETLTLSGTGTLADKNVGINKPVNLGSLTLGNGTGLAANYTFAGGTQTATITKADLAVTGLSASNKTYDGTTTATLTGTATVTALGSDSVTLGGTAVGAFADKNVGAGKTVTVTGNTLSGTDAGNYNLIQQAGLAANIGKADLAVTGLSASNKTYDATTDATLTGTATVTALGSDSVTLGGTAVGAFADKNVGTGKTVTVTGNTLSGTDAGNYNLIQQAGLTANIGKADLAATGLSASNKTYDATTTATLTGTATVTALGSDSVTLGGTAVGAFADKNVGAGKTVTVTGNTLSGTDAGNYNLIQQAGLTANIGKADLVVTGLSASNKTYDATTDATLTGTATIAALAGDSVNLGGTPSGAFADKNVGTAKAVTVTGNTIGGADAGNYNLVQQTGLSADITPKLLNITGVTAGNKVYDASTAATLGGTAMVRALGGDEVGVGGTGVGVFADANVGTGKAVTVSGFTLSGKDAGNYTAAQPAGLTADIVESKAPDSALSLIATMTSTPPPSTEDSKAEIKPDDKKESKEDSDSKKDSKPDSQKESKNDQPKKELLNEVTKGAALEKAKVGDSASDAVDRAKIEAASKPDSKKDSRPDSKGGDDENNRQNPDTRAEMKPEAKKDSDSKRDPFEKLKPDDRGSQLKKETPSSSMDQKKSAVPGKMENGK